MPDFLAHLGEGQQQLRLDFISDAANPSGASGLVLGVHRLGHRLLGGGLHGLHQFSILGRRFPLHLRLAGLLDQVSNQLDLLHDADLGDLEAVEDLCLADFKRAALDHHDRVGEAGNDQVKGRELELLEGRIQDPVVFDLADPGGRNRAVPRNLGDGERGRGCQHANHIRLVLLVGGQHGHEHLHLVTEALPGRADGWSGR